MSDPSLPQYPQFPAAPPPYPPPSPGYGDFGAPAPIAKPASLKRAVYFMCAGGVLDLVGLVLVIADRASLRSTLRQHFPHYTTTQINQTVNSLIIGIGIVVALWAIMAWANWHGYQWARVVASILFGLATLEALATLAGSQSGVGTIIGLLPWLCGLGATVLMWRQSSTEYYRGKR